MISLRGASRVSTTFRVTTEPLRQAQMEPIEQRLLPGIWPADAAQAEGPPIGRLQEDVATLDPSQAVQGLLRRHGRPCPLQSAFQRDPQGVAEEGHQDVGLHAGRLLVPDGPDRELALEGAEGRLGLRELHLLRPQLGRVRLRQVRAQEVRAFARLTPRTPVRSLPPDHLPRARWAGHGDLVQRGHARVALQELADPSLEVRLLGQPAGLHLPGEARQIRFQGAAGPFAHGPFFRPTQGAAAEDEAFVASGAGHPLHLNLILTPLRSRQGL